VVGAGLTGKDGAQTARRWVNSNATVGADSRAAGPRTANGSLVSKPAEYDDQGRPILPVYRSALTERRMRHPGITELTERRKESDRTLAEVLAIETEKELEAFPTPDPLDAMLVPFVPAVPVKNPAEALTAALKSVRHVEVGASSLKRNKDAGESDRPGSAAGARGSVASFDWEQSSVRDTTRSFAGKGPFTLDFHLTNIEDERRLASHTSVFRPIDEPTIANGGVVSLAQLAPGYGRATDVRKAADILNRDASAGDLSLLQPTDPYLQTVLTRRALDAQRPAFSLAFSRATSATQRARDLLLSNIISRDGGLTTAEEAERWRQEQLGIGWNVNAAAVRRAKQQTGGDEEAALAAAETIRLRSLHAHTHFKPVYTDHRAPGAHSARHPPAQSHFSTLFGPGGSPLEQSAKKVPLLEQSEREASIRALGPLAIAKMEREKAEDTRREQRAKIKPSERRAQQEEEQKKRVSQQFPFQSWPETQRAFSVPKEQASTRGASTLRQLAASGR
jgi:hypothetical protein